GWTGFRHIDWVHSDSSSAEGMWITSRCLVMEKYLQAVSCRTMTYTIPVTRWEINPDSLIRLLVKNRLIKVDTIFAHLVPESCSTSQANSESFPTMIKTKVRRVFYLSALLDSQLLDLAKANGATLSETARMLLG